MSEVSQPNEQLIAETLEQITDGEWVCDGFGSITVKGTGKFIATAYHPDDFELIANAPEWLRALLEENKRLKHRDRVVSLTNETLGRYVREGKEELEQVKAELERSQGSHMFQYGLSLELEIKRLKVELEQEKQLTELFDQRGEVIEKLLDTKESFRAELSAKDRVLELYASEDMYTVLHLGCSPMVMADHGRQARTILSQYRGDTHE